MLKNVYGFLGGAVIFDERVANLFGRSADKLEVSLQKEIETVNRIDIEGVADRQDEAICAESDGDDLESVRVFRADLRDNVWRNDHRGKIDPIHVGLRGERTRDLVG